MPELSFCADHHVLAISTMLKKSFTVLLLMLLPLSQARPALACAMMDGVILQECCCGHRDVQASERDQDAANRCCRIVLESRPQSFTIGAPAPSVQKPASAQHDDDPPLLLLPIASAPVHVSVARASPRAVVFDARSSVVPLYLLTARLRL